MSKEGPLRWAKERVSLDIRCARARAKSTHFVFQEEFTDERFAESVRSIRILATYGKSSLRRYLWCS